MASGKEDVEGTVHPLTPPPKAYEERPRSSEPDTPVVLANQVDAPRLDACLREGTPSTAQRRLDLDEPLLQDNDERFCLLPVK